MLPDDFPAPQREKEDGKTACLFSGGQFKYPVGMVLTISREGSSFDGLSRGRSLDWDNSQRRGPESKLPLDCSSPFECQGLRWRPSHKHSRLLGFMNANGYVKLPPNTFSSFLLVMVLSHVQTTVSSASFCLSLALGNLPRSFSLIF